jgi:hypothetical protein
MTIFRRNAGARRLAGFPDTDVVVAKRDKQSGVISVRNGYNLFRLPSLDFFKVSAAEHDGAFALVGFSDAGSARPLATFGSMAAAMSALDQVCKVSTGTAAGKGIRWFRWGLGLGAAFIALRIVFTILGAVVAASAHASVPTKQISFDNVPSVGGSRPVAVAAAVGGFNANEPTQEDEIRRLSAGGEYKFQPNLQTPNVQAPVLKCAAPTAGVKQ